MANAIELKSYDLLISEFKDKETGETKEIARLSSRLAFDESFIAELKEIGVKKFVKEGGETAE